MTLGLMASLPGVAAAATYDLTVDEVIGADEYWHYRLNLTADEPISISLSVTGGTANFYFMDAEGYAAFRYAWNGSLFNYFTYYPALSAEDTTTISKSALIPTTDTYYVVVYCDDWYALHLTGEVTAGAKPFDASGLLIAVGVIVGLAVIPIAAFVLQNRSRRMKRMQAIQSGAMPRCPQCGAFNEETMFFCASCGFKLKG